jgi:hypothetical protein
MPGTDIVHRCTHTLYGKCCILTKDIVGLKSITDELETELEIYLKIFVMLYADDTILLAESAEDLQVQLNAFGEYCDNLK